jgi:hypothetical protein
MTLALLKGAVIWLLLVAVAVGNGVFRDTVLARVSSPALALPLSGVMLALLILLVAFLSVPLIASRRARVYWSVGLLWVSLTLAFELLFGHYAAGKPWNEIWQVFNVAGGDLFLPVLVVSGLAPWLAARARRLV